MRWHSILLVTFILSTACLSDEEIYFKEDRLAGEWILQKTSFSEAASLSETILPATSHLSQLALYLDGRIQFLDSDNTTWGNWEIHYIDVYSPYYKKASYQFISTVNPLSEEGDVEMVGYIFRLSETGFELHIPSQSGLTKYYYKKQS